MARWPSAACTSSTSLVFEYSAIANVWRLSRARDKRHTFAMGLYGRTGDVLLVKEALGHRAITSTMVYARASAERVRAAVVG